jgi:hypothetical protein
MRILFVKESKNKKKKKSDSPHRQIARRTIFLWKKNRNNTRAIRRKLRYIRGTYTLIPFMSRRSVFPHFRFVPHLWYMLTSAVSYPWYVWGTCVLPHLVCVGPCVPLSGVSWVCMFPPLVCLGSVCSHVWCVLGLYAFISGVSWICMFTHLL